MYVKNAFPK